MYEKLKQLYFSLFKCLLFLLSTLKVRGQLKTGFWEIELLTFIRPSIFVWKELVFEWSWILYWQIFLSRQSRLRWIRIMKSYSIILKIFLNLESQKNCLKKSCFCMTILSYTLERKELIFLESNFNPRLKQTLIESNISVLVTNAFGCS